VTKINLFVVTTSVILCLLAFRLSVAKNLTDESSTFIALMSIFLQIFLQCNFGQKLMDASSEMAEAAYTCDWERNDDKELKKCLQLIIVRSQKAATLKFGKFGDIFLEQFLFVSFFGFANCENILI
jgi:hypothetical protein